MVIYMTVLEIQDAGCLIKSNHKLNIHVFFISLWKTTKFIQIRSWKAFAPINTPEVHLFHRKQISHSSLLIFFHKCIFVFLNNIPLLLKVLWIWQWAPHIFFCMWIKNQVPLDLQILLKRKILASHFGLEYLEREKNNSVSIIMYS